MGDQTTLANRDAMGKKEIGKPPKKDFAWYHAVGQEAEL